VGTIAPIGSMESAPMPQMCPPAAGLRIHLAHGSLSPQSPQPKRHIDRFIHFCTAHGRDQKTHTQAHRPHYSLCSNRPHLFSACDAVLDICWPSCQTNSVRERLHTDTAPPKFSDATTPLSRSTHALMTGATMTTAKTQRGSCVFIIDYIYLADKHVV